MALVLGEPAPQPASDDFFGGGEPAVRALLCPEPYVLLLDGWLYTGLCQETKALSSSGTAAGDVGRGRLRVRRRLADGGRRRRRDGGLHGGAPAATDWTRHNLCRGRPPMALRKDAAAPLLRLTRSRARRCRLRRGRRRRSLRRVLRRGPRRRRRRRRRATSRARSTSPAGSTSLASRRSTGARRPTRRRPPRRSDARLPRVNVCGSRRPIKVIDQWH